MARSWGGPENNDNIANIIDLFNRYNIFLRSQVRTIKYRIK
jgi:hypothetical protein